MTPTRSGPPRTRPVPACVGYDPEWWFAPEGSPGDVLAARLCEACPVAAGCYNGAVQRGETAGRWGGRVFPLPQLELVDAGPVVEPWHGTDAGFKAHGCREDCCRVAHAKAMARWRLHRTPMAAQSPMGPATPGPMVDLQLALFQEVSP